MFANRYYGPTFFGDRYFGPSTHFFTDAFVFGERIAKTIPDYRVVVAPWEDRTVVVEPVFDELDTVDEDRSVKL